MSRKSVIIAAGLTLGGSLAVGAQAAGAQAAGAAGDTLCVNEFEITPSPGLSSAPPTGTFTSNGETGTATCDGPVHGVQPTGPGRHGESGRYGLAGPETCSSGGVVDWTFSTTLPTSGGDLHLAGTVKGAYGMLQGGGVFGGTMTGEGTHGRFTATPIDGDCVTAPITRIRVRCEQWFVNEN
jgi:hypothetical protein